MLNTAIVGMGGWGRTLVNSVQGRNGAGIRFVWAPPAIWTRRATTPPRRASACIPAMKPC